VSTETDERAGIPWGRRSEKVAAVLARQIVRDIADRELGPGSALEPEGVMVERYQVSRASLREALRILEIQGLIAIKPGPGGGPLVSDVDSRDFGRMSTLFYQVLGVRFREVVDARLILEPVMAGLAAENDDEDAKRRLGEIAKAGWETKDNAEWLRRSDEFHGQVIGMSGNSLLGLLARSLKNIYTDRVSGLMFPDSERDRVRKVHDAIAKAIMAGDGRKARRLMEDHMREYADNIAERHPTLMEEVVDWR
jgi:GntR family transcriptional repressor for pyruvate dehydrogenase complex